MPDSLIPCVLAVDVGSSAVRAAVIDADGVRLGECRVARADSMSGTEFHADTLWNQVAAVIVALPAGLRGRVTGIGIAGHIGTVFTDAALCPVGPAYGWADVTGLDEFAQRLGRSVGEALAEMGRPSLTGGGVAAALALRTDVPADFRRIKHILHPKDYLVARLTGEVITDFTSAAYTGGSSTRGRHWSPRILSAVDLDPSLFPEQHASTAVVGTVLPAVAAELGLPADTSVVAGGPDGTVGATYIIGKRRDVIADVAGTTDVLVRVVEHPDLGPAGSIVNPYTLGNWWSAGGATGMTGGALNKWSRLLGLGSPAEALKDLWPRMAAIGPGSEGLSIQPSLSGSRFPRWDAKERGHVRGQSDAHGAEHFIRAVVEGAAYICREGIDILAGTAGASMAVVLAGGAARSPELAQLRADILNREILVYEEADVSLMGAGLLAAVGTGLHETVAEMSTFGQQARSVEPDRVNSERYDDLYREWLAGSARNRGQVSPERIPTTRPLGPASGSWSGVA